MGMVFQLGHNDHKVVADFLLRRPAGVEGITLHAKAARYQQAAAEAAVAAGAGVFFNPATERLTGPGYVLREAPYNADAPYDVDALAADPSARARLIEHVLAGHPASVTAATPPHFIVNGPRSANLNVVLAADTLNSTDLPVRAVLLLDRRYGLKVANDLAQQYREAGITELELRLTPFGGEDESLAKITSGFHLLDTFRGAGITTILGCSGNVGRAAFAFDHADGYSVGIGVLEHVDHTGTMSQQRKPPKLDEHGKKKPAPGFQGVYLPGIAQTLTRTTATTLLAHTDIRLRLGCRLEACGTSVDGPTRDYQRHYLHARAQEMADLDRQPKPWRATAEIERLRRVLALRKLINDKYRPEGTPALRTRTLQSILDLPAEGGQAQAG